MKALIRSLLLTLMLAAACGCAMADSTVLLIDASGSMAGFFTTRSIHDVHKDLASALKINGTDVQSYAFKHTLSAGGNVITNTVPFGPSVPADGAITLVDKAYEAASAKHPDAGMIWLVTDNVQDPLVSGEEREDIEKFYRSIENDQRIYRVYFFIRTMDFNGPLYKRGGHVKLVDSYHGKRSVIVYAILLKPEMQQIFDRAAQSLAKDGIGPTLVKGLSSAPIRVIDKPELSKTAEEKIPAAQRLVLRDGKVTSPSNHALRESEPIHGTFAIGFESQASNIKISQPDIVAEVVRDFETTTGDILKLQPKILVTPSRLAGDLLPEHETSDIGRSWVQVDIEFPSGVKFSHSLGAMWRDLWRRSGSKYEGTIKVTIKARKSAFDFSPKMIQEHNAGPEYFTEATEAAQSRIPELDSLFRQLNQQEQEEVEIVSKPFQISFPVQYPRYPLALLFLGITLGGALAYVFWKLSRNVEFALETVTPMRYRFLKHDAPKAAASSELSLDNAFAPSESLASNNHATPIQFGWLRGYDIRDGNRILGVIRRQWGVKVEAARGFLVEGRSVLPLSEGQIFSFSEKGAVSMATAEAKPQITGKPSSVDVPDSGF